MEMGRRADLVIPIFQASERVKHLKVIGGGLSRLLRRLNRIVYSCEIVHGAQIPPSCIFVHGGLGVVIGSGVVLGERCIIHQNVTIGADLGQTNGLCPHIGNDVILCAGCCVIGNVMVGDGAIIGANAVVTRDVSPGATVVGANRIL